MTIPYTYWTKSIPTEEGWYWRKRIIKRHPEEEEPEIVKVRWYCDKLSIGNYDLPKDGYLWAGPIGLPYGE
jgi:hypothetical protein